jgi:hypothetical protein
MKYLDRTLSFLAASVLAGSASAQPAGSPVAPSVLNPNRYAVTGVPAAKRFMQLAATRRVDIAIIGDSNTRQLSVTGHEDGMARAFAARFGIYATRVDPFAAQGSWAAPTFASAAGQFPPFASTGAPAVADQYTFVGDGVPASYGLLAASDQMIPSYNVGWMIEPDHPLGIEHSLRYHLSDLAIGSGTWVFSVRAPWPGDAFTNLFSFQVTPAPTAGVRDLYFDIPAGPRPSNGIIVVPADLANGRVSVGPLLALYNRLERVDQATGIAYSPMWFQGGQSARKALADFQLADQNVTAMREWMRQATRLQGAPGVLLVHIMHGGNDPNDPLPSLGPQGGIPSNTPAGQQDNTQGIINWVRDAWVGAGRDPQNLFFLLGPYHPLADRLTVQQGFEQGWRDIAADDPQVFTVAGSMLSTPDEFVALGFNRSATEPAHLSIQGYWSWGTATVEALNRAVCPADFDANSVVNSADIFAFIDAWFAGDRKADADYSGTLDAYDIFSFLETWFAGC